MNLKRWTRKILSFGLAMVITCSTAVVALADSSDNSGSVIQIPDGVAGEIVRIPAGNAEYIKYNDGTLIKISDLPSFDTQEEADRYMENFINALECAESENINGSVEICSSHGDSIVDSRQISGATLRLRVSYTTYGDNFTGSVTSCQAYTTFSGVTVGLSWNEKTCYANIVGSRKKDIYAYAAGEVVQSLLVNGIIETGRRSVTLSGTIAASH